VLFLNCNNICSNIIRGLGVAFWANMSSLYQNKGLDELYPMVPKIPI